MMLGINLPNPVLYRESISKRFSLIGFDNMLDNGRYHNPEQFDILLSREIAEQDKLFSLYNTGFGKLIPSII
jgi:hypothetical protein